MIVHAAALYEPGASYAVITGVQIVNEKRQLLRLMAAAAVHFNYLLRPIRESLSEAFKITADYSRRLLIKYAFDPARGLIGSDYLLCVVL